MIKIQRCFAYRIKSPISRSEEINHGWMKYIKNHSLGLRFISDKHNKIKIVFGRNKFGYACLLIFEDQKSS